MKQTINFSDFHNAFRAHDRLTQFSYDALKVIFEYLEEYEEGTGEEIELDVVGICCDFAESDADDVIRDYRLDASDCDDEEDRVELAREYLTDNTILLGETPSGFVFQNF